MIYDMRIVLDTNVLVAGLLSSKGASYQILNQIPKGKISYLVSVALFLEYEAVLKRNAFLQQAELTTTDIDNILNMLAKHAILTRIHYLWRPQLRDPNDDMVLELAVSGNADAIVTFNQKDFIMEKFGFDIQIITPGQYYKQCLWEQ